MSTRHYHTPPPQLSTRVRCPVCRETVYSRAGIHPQCALRQSEPPRPKPQNASPTEAELVGKAPGQAEAEVAAAASSR